MVVSGLTRTFIQGGGILNNVILMNLRMGALNIEGGENFQWIICYHLQGSTASGTASIQRSPFLFFNHNINTQLKLNIRERFRSKI